MNMATDPLEVQGLLGYSFRNPALLVEALTHPSYANTKAAAKSNSYQRLEFMGDAILGLAVTDHIYSTYLDLGPGPLTILRSANVSTEKLARVAVHYNLYSYLRRNARDLDQIVQTFTDAIRDDPVEVPYYGTVKAPKVLADIVESIAAAVYFDCGSNIEAVWRVFCPLLDPIITPETLRRQPVTMLYEFCQKKSKRVEIEFSMDGGTHIAKVFVDEEEMGVGFSGQNNEMAKLNAAKEAMQKLLESETLEIVKDWKMMWGK